MTDLARLSERERSARMNALADLADGEVVTAAASLISMSRDVHPRLKHVAGQLGRDRAEAAAFAMVFLCGLVSASEWLRAELRERVERADHDSERGTDGA